MKKRDILEIFLIVVSVATAILTQVDVSKNCEAGLLGFSVTVSSRYLSPMNWLALIALLFVTIFAISFSAWESNKEKNFRTLLKLGREKKRMKLAFRESEQKYQMLFQSNIAGFALHEIVCDERGKGVDYRFLEINPAFMTLTGLKEDCIVGKKITEILPEIEKCWIDRYVKVAMTGEAVHFEYYSKELEKYFEVTAYSPKKFQFATVFLDITEKKRFELEQMRIQKLEALGVLAGGIAHDFNNIMMGIMGYASLAMMEKGARQQLVNEKIVAAVERASVLTRQLMEFAKGDQPHFRVISVAKIIKEASDFCLNGASSRCEMSVPEDIWSIEADSIQIGRVIQNLVMNANQAMIEGGIIRIIGENLEVSVDNPYHLPQGKYIHISVSDEGLGIPEKYLKRIFEPYFSTKKQFGAGSGLGLAVAYSVIQNHNGKIEVESQVGFGTTFHIFLPALLRTVSKDTASVVYAGRVARSLKVLVMDDEDSVREFLDDALQLLGHTAVTARHGVEALEKYCAAIDSGSPFDLVIFDMTIPCGMGGEATMKKILELNADAIGIMSSGYTGKKVQEGLFRTAINKPYTVKDLDMVIDSVCGE